MVDVLLARETVEGEAVQALLDGKWEHYLQNHPEYMENDIDQNADTSARA